MKKILVPIVLVPAAVLIAVTLLRAWLELAGSPSAGYASANGLGMLWLLVAPTMMLRRGVSLGVGVLGALLFFVLHRAVIGVVYAMAWSGKWTVEGTGEPVRYVAQTQADMPDASPVGVMLGMTFFPTAFALVLFLVVWVITWLIGFRKRRGLVRAAG